MAKTVTGKMIATVWNAIICRDPTFAETSKGTKVANFDVAINSRFGERLETMFMKCEAYGATADLIYRCKYQKGDPIHFACNMRCSQWETKEGDKLNRAKLNVMRPKSLG